MDDELFWKIRKITSNSYKEKNYLSDISKELKIDEKEAERLLDAYKKADEIRNIGFHKMVDEITINYDNEEESLLREQKNYFGKFKSHWLFRNKYLFFAYLILILSPLYINFISPVNYDNIASFSLALILIAEYKLVTFKQLVETSALKKSEKGRIAILQNMLRVETDKEKEEMYYALNDYVDNSINSEASIHGYETYDMLNKVLEKEEKLVIFGIFITTIIWGFGGFF